MSDRSVILITADSIRADYCGVDGYEYETTPFLSSKQENAVVFENAVAPGPRTLSSVPVSMTGEHMSMNDDDMTVYDNRVARIRHHMNRYHTIAERFQERGYRTVGFSPNPWTSKSRGFDTGFDYYDEFKNNNKSSWYQDLFKGTSLETPSRFLEQWLHNKVWFSQWPTFYNNVKQTLEDSQKPFFLWVFLLDTHNPYFPARQDRIESSTFKMYTNMLRGNSLFNQTGKMTTHKEEMPDQVLKNIKKAYRDSIRSVDRFVETIYDDFKSDNPVLLFHSDHGESFGDHGSFGHQPILYEENIRVLLILINTELSGIESKPISLKKIPDLLTSAADGEFGSPSNYTDQYVFSKTEDNSVRAIRGTKWKLIQSHDENELYDIGEDPNEQVDCSEDQPDVVKELQNKLEAFIGSLPSGSVKEATVGEDEKAIQDRLESLGYIT